MPNLSHRAEAMPASPIRKLVPFAEAAVARGVSIHHLNIGQPDLPAPAEFWDGVRSAIGELVEYTHSAGLAPLRTAARDLYRSQGIDLEANELMVTTAGSEALGFAMLACCNPGDEVIVPEPCYANYLSFAIAAGVTVVPLPCRIEDDFQLPDLAEFEAKVTPRTRAILICNPNNPTGAVYHAAQLEALADLCRRHDLYLVADEVYREFNYTGEPVPSVLQIPDFAEHAVMVDSASKRYSLCGARIGFLCSRNAGLMDAALRMGQARLSPPLLEQQGVAAATRTPQSYFDAMREEYRARRDTVVGRLTAMPGVVVPRVDGAFYATVRLPIDDADRFCQWLLESFDHAGETVMLAPATGFYATPGAGRDEVRIAYVLKQERLDRAMDCLAAALAKYS